MGPGDAHGDLAASGDCAACLGARHGKPGPGQGDAVPPGGRRSVDRRDAVRDPVMILGPGDQLRSVELDSRPHRLDPVEHVGRGLGGPVGARRRARRIHGGNDGCCIRRRRVRARPGPFHWPGARLLSEAADKDRVTPRKKGGDGHRMGRVMGRTVEPAPNPHPGRRRRGRRPRLHRSGAGARGLAEGPARAPRLPVHRDREAQRPAGLHPRGV